MDTPADRRDYPGMRADGTTCCACGDGVCSALFGRTLWGGNDIRKVGLAAQVRRKVENNNMGCGSKIDIMSLRLRLDPSRSISKNYDILEPIGDGAFGVVMLARVKQTGDMRAVKTISKRQMEGNMQLLIGELEAMVHLDHPNVVRLFEFFEDKKEIHLVTDYVSGGDFSDLHYKQDSMEDIKLLFRDLIGAVAYCHDHGMAHRDLKFENCLISAIKGQRRVCKVIDFGLAAIQQEGDQGKWLNEQLGTRYFVAPEVIDTSRLYGFKCDCWSIGVMLYIVLTDEHPCSSRAHNLDIGQLFKKILDNSIRKTPMEDADAPLEARDLILKLLVKDQDHRIEAKDALQHPWFQTDKIASARRFSWKSKSTVAQQNLSLVPTAWMRKSSPADNPLSHHRLHRLKSFRSYSAFEKAILTIVAHQSHDKDVEELRQSFMALDTSGTGSLSLDEVRQGIKEAGLNVSNQECQDIFESLDMDGTGKIHYTEWLAATVKPATVSSERAIKQVFEHFDIEQNGVVSREELLHVIGDTELVDSVFAEADLHGTGKLSEAKFTVFVNNIARKLHH